MREGRAFRRALVLESDPLTSERLRMMLRSEAFQTCAVDDWDGFAELARGGRFELFAVSDAVLDDPVTCDWLRKLDPLLIPYSSDDPSAIGRLRLLLPGAHFVDRTLRDPDALRRALGGLPPAAPRPASVPAASGGDAVRVAFGAFGLSERQLEVLACALRGATSREIAARLYISEPTVRNHLHAIYERIGVSGRRELLGRFVHQLIGPVGSPDGSRAVSHALRAASGTRAARVVGGS